MKIDPDDPHGGDTCQEVEEQLDHLTGELNEITFGLHRRGYKIDFRENDSVAYWVLYALKHGRPKRKRWWRR